MRRKFTDIAPAVCALLAVAAIGAILCIASRSLWSISDLPEYYAAAKLILSGEGAKIYDLQALAMKEQQCFPLLGERRIWLMFVPIAAPLTVPIGLCSPTSAVFVWKFINVLALAGSLLLLKWWAPLSTKQWWWFVTWTVLSGPVFEALRIDQPAPLLLLAFSLTLMALKSERPFLAAVALTFLWIKPQEILAFLVLLAGTKRYKVLTYWSGLSLLLGLISIWQIGINGWLSYAMVLTPIARKLMQPELTPTFRGQLLRLFPSANMEVIVISLVILAVSLAIIYKEGRLLLPSRNWLELGVMMVMPLGLLTSLHCHDYDLLLLLPSIAILLKFSDKIVHLRSQLLILVCVGVLFMLPFYASIHYDFLLKGAALNPYFFVLLIFSVSVFVIFRSNQGSLQEAMEA